MATRIQIRRDTQANWANNNPILASGEIAFSTDQYKIKIGDGTSNWSSLSYMTATPTEITNQINAAVSSLIDSAPGTLDTLNELAAALNDDPDFFNTVATNLSNHESDTTNVHGIADTSLLATTSYVDTAESDAITSANSYSDGLAVNYDPAGSASAVASDLTDHENSTTNVHGIADTSLLATTSYVDTAESDAISSANSYSDSLAINYDPSGSAASAQAAANSYSDSLAVNYDPAGSAASAQSAAESYADSLAVNYDVAGAASAVASDLTDHENSTTNVHGIDDTSELATKTYADNAATTAVSNLIDSAPETLNTLNELAAALGDDANFATTVANNIATKADATDLTSHENSTTNVHGIADTAALATTSYVDTAESDAISSANSYSDSLAVNYDPAGSAASAQSAAESYADSLAVNYDPAGSAASAQSAAESYADSLAVNYDPAGSAASAQSGAESYADSLAVNYDPAGSAASAQSAAESYADSEISAHNSDTTDVHGISNTANLVYTSDSRLSDARTPTSHTHPTSDITNFTEDVQDIVGEMISSNTESGISVTFDDDLGKLNFNVNDPTITISGDVTGSATMTDLGNVTITTTISADSVALGTDTTGDYVASITGTPNQISTTGTEGEVKNVVLSLPQNIHTEANPTFAGALLGNINFGITSDNEIDTVSGNLVIDSADGTVTIDDNLIVSGDLTVSGTTTYVNTENINLADNIITLNSNASGSPSEDAGIEIERGDSTNVLLRWNETNDSWEATRDGTNYLQLVLSGDDIPTSDIINFSQEVLNAVAGAILGNQESGITVEYDNQLQKVNFNVNDPTITLSGDITGSATMTNLENVEIVTTLSSQFQPLNGNLSAISGVTAEQDKFIYFTGVGNGVSTSTITILGRQIVESINSQSARDILGIPNVEDVAISTWQGSTNISNLGTVTVGTWNASIINKNYIDSDIARLESPTFIGTVNLPHTTSIGDISSTEISYLDGVTSAIQTQINSIESSLNNKIDSSTASTTYSPIISPTFTGTVSLPNDTSIGDISSTEISYLDGVTSAIQTQLNGKLESSVASTTYAPLDSPSFTTSASLPSNTSIGSVTSTEISYLGGVTSAIQTQINSKSPIESPTFTGTVSGITKSMVGLGNVDNTSDANKPVSTAQQTALDLKANLSGATFSGFVTLHADPTQATHAATKQYVDETAEGLRTKPAVEIATTGNLVATYDNGTNGVGATLTATSNGAFPTIDGVTLSSTTPGQNGVLVKNQSTSAENGRYNLTQVGDENTPWILTRCGLCDEADEIPGAYIFVKQGTLNAGSGWVQVVSNPATFVVGTDSISVIQFSGAGTITAGTNISVTGSQVSTVNDPTFSGLVTASSGVAFSDGTQTKVGVPSISSFVSKTSSYTLDDLTLRDNIIEVDSTSATIVTIPLDSTLNYPIGSSIDVFQINTGQVTIAGDSGVTVNATPGLKLRTQWSSCTLLKRAANTWIVYGDLKA